jgi:hypothetical protein
VCFSAFISLLSALLAHPEFQQGVRFGQDGYFDLYDEAPLTEEEMIKEVEMNLSRRTAKVDQQAAAMMGWKAPLVSRKAWVGGWHHRQRTELPGNTTCSIAIVSGVVVYIPDNMTICS